VSPCRGDHTPGVLGRRRRTAAPRLAGHPPPRLNGVLHRGVTQPRCPRRGSVLTATAMKVAFLGLGVMGYRMAGHLARTGHEVTVYNRTASKAEAWCGEHGGARGGTPREAASGASMVFTCVGNDDDLRQVTLGVGGGAQGCLDGMDRGAILVDHTTASAEIARELAGRAKDRGVGFLDAP